MALWNQRSLEHLDEEFTLIIKMTKNTFVNIHDPLKIQIIPFLMCHRTEIMIGRVFITFPIDSFHTACYTNSSTHFYQKAKQLISICHEENQLIL